MKTSMEHFDSLDDMADFPEELNVKAILEKVKVFLVVKQLKEDSSPNLVIPNLYIGCLGTVLNKKKLYETQITHILSVCEMPIFPYQAEDFKSLLININDSVDQEIKSKFEIANDFIHSAIKNKQNVLIHCFAGKSRSASFVIAYLIKYLQMTPLQALKLLQSRRRIAQPNMGFMKQLDAYHKELYRQPQIQKEQKQIESSYIQKKVKSNQQQEHLQQSNDQQILNS
ncbi:unnamed protein product [Paramecium pentaurelia]|uniref:Uncharacterized protein n=1 Tax=Paramecium pentaurelia TaxID=43138 RepID=A0A8S1X3L8_9CILI|nr:unnamed protein product [Paramecium pentaurelia]